jgi:V/A-type H+/Na+-transporting ATPase subunit I
MFKPEIMFRTIALIPKDKVHIVVSLLHQRKVCQIKKSENKLDEIKPLEDEERVLRLYSRLAFVKESLDSYSNKKAPNLLKEYFSKKKVTRYERKPLPKEELMEKAEQCLDIVEENVKENVREIKKIDDQKNKNEYMISNLKYLPNIQTDLLQDSEYIKNITGIINNSDIEKIKNELGNKAVIIIHTIDKKISLLIIKGMQENLDKIKDSIHQIGFQDINFPYEDKLPINIIKRLRNENNELLTKENELFKELHKTYISYHAILKYFQRELNILKQKIDAVMLMRGSSSFATLECWLPEKNVETFKYLLETNATGYYIAYQEQDDAPTLLNNHKWIKPFETLTELYSLPKYKNMDPTPILAITFSIFFGFMLTDFVYGAVLLVLGILLLRGKGSYDESTRNIGVILSGFGIFTIILGIVFGSYFGDFFQQLGFNVPMLVDSMSQVMIVLIIALLIGIVHLSIGLIVGFLENMKKGKIADALKNQGVWLLFIMAIGMFLLKWMIIGYVLLASSILMLIVITAKESGGISALLSVFSFPGFIGDLFSYGRLMALAIGTTGIALAVNFMAIMAWDIPYVGWLAAILIFLVGHIFNMAMNGLGAFVHSIRLHFLEFFSKFYEGAGKKYIPFGNET